jgi:hypothetical protein
MPFLGCRVAVKVESCALTGFPSLALQRRQPRGASLSAMGLLQHSGVAGFVSAIGRRQQGSRVPVARWGNKQAAILTIVASVSSVSSFCECFKLNISHGLAGVASGWIVRSLAMTLRLSLVMTKFQRQWGDLESDDGALLALGSLPKLSPMIGLSDDVCLDRVEMVKRRPGDPCQTACGT